MQVVDHEIVTRFGFMPAAQIGVIGRQLVVGMGNDVGIANGP